MQTATRNADGSVRIVSARHSGPPSPSSSSSGKDAAPTRRRQLGQMYGKLVSSLIRPPRASYSLADLDSHRVTEASMLPSQTTRVEFEVTNARGEKLQCSRWTPRYRSNQGNNNVVMYCHANSSCRVGAVRSSVVSTVCGLEAEVVAFDFAGCGQSEGDYVTLGVHEKHDVDAVVRSILKRQPGARIVLWGRSMGAVAALLYCEEYNPPSVVALVLDSPFYSMRRIVQGVQKQIVAAKAPCRCCVPLLVCSLRRSARRKCGEDVFRVDCAQAAKNSTRPALILGALRDNLSPPEEHAMALQKVWATADDSVHNVHAEVLKFEGDHNSQRPTWVYDVVRRFVRDALHTEEEQEEEVAVVAEEKLAECWPPPQPKQQPINNTTEDDNMLLLPQGWKSATDEETGDEYYFRANSTSGDTTTTWLRPRAPAPDTHDEVEDDSEAPLDLKPPPPRSRGRQSTPQQRKKDGGFKMPTGGRGIGGRGIGSNSSRRNHEPPVV